MNRQVKIKEQIISYTLKTSTRSKSLRLAIFRNCSLVVTRPEGLAENVVESFMQRKAEWILAKFQYFKSLPSADVKIELKEYRQNKKAALHLVRGLLAEYNQFYNFKINSVKIKNQKTRWGSCSRQGNLNFSYRLALLPEDLARYIVVHELCHLKELNHSARFWQLVSQTCPDYLAKRKQLRLIK